MPLFKVYRVTQLVCRERDFCEVEAITAESAVDMYEQTEKQKHSTTFSKGRTVFVAHEADAGVDDGDVWAQAEAQLPALEAAPAPIYRRKVAG